MVSRFEKSGYFTEISMKDQISKVREMKLAINYRLGKKSPKNQKNRRNMANISILVTFFDEKIESGCMHMWGRITRKKIIAKKSMIS